MYSAWISSIRDPAGLGGEEGGGGAGCAHTYMHMDSDDTVYQWRPPNNALYLWQAEVHRRCHLRDASAGGKLERGGHPW